MIFTYNLTRNCKFLSIRKHKYNNFTTFFKIINFLHVKVFDTTIKVSPFQFFNKIFRGKKN